LPRRWLAAILLPLLFALAGVAQAKDEEGMLVEVQVVDAGGHAIPNAWVRVPDTEGRRSVSPQTGVWSARYLYSFDGVEVYFKRGEVLEMTISAPGYQARVARYRVRRGKNELHVVLDKLPAEQAQADSDISWFRRDSVPRNPSEKGADAKDPGAQAQTGDQDHTGDQNAPAPPTGAPHDDP